MGLGGGNTLKFGNLNLFYRWRGRPLNFLKCVEEIQVDTLKFGNLIKTCTYNSKTVAREFDLKGAVGGKRTRDFPRAHVLGERWGVFSIEVVRRQRCGSCGGGFDVHRNLDRGSILATVDYANCNFGLVIRAHGRNRVRGNYVAPED